MKNRSFLRQLLVVLNFDTSAPYFSCDQVVNICDNLVRNRRIMGCWFTFCRYANGYGRRYADRRNTLQQPSRLACCLLLFGFGGISVGVSVDVYRCQQSCRASKYFTGRAIVHRRIVWLWWDHGERSCKYGLIIFRLGLYCWICWLSVDSSYCVIRTMTSTCRRVLQFYLKPQLIITVVSIIKTEVLFTECPKGLRNRRGLQNTDYKIQQNTGMRTHHFWSLSACQFLINPLARPVMRMWE